MSALDVFQAAKADAENMADLLARSQIIVNYEVSGGRCPDVEDQMATIATNALDDDHDTIRNVIMRHCHQRVADAAMSALQEAQTVQPELQMAHNQALMYVKELAGAAGC